LLTEQQKRNWSLYRNINAHKTNSELDLINIYLFSGRTYTIDYKKRLYPGIKYEQRL
jgi:hypothetical protein